MNPDTNTIQHDMRRLQLVQGSKLSLWACVLNGFQQSAGLFASILLAEQLASLPL